MGNKVVVPYDESRGGEWLSHNYFVKRNQGDMHYAWMWVKYIAQNRNIYHREQPSQYLIINKTEELYEIHKNTEEFQKFVKWMGPIPV